MLRKDREAALLQTEQGKLTAQKAALAPWLSLDLPLESGSTREMLVQFGTLTAARPWRRHSGRWRGPASWPS